MVLVPVGVAWGSPGLAGETDRRGVWHRKKDSPVSW
jgi:hypothetical protein